MQPKKHGGNRRCPARLRRCSSRRFPRPSYGHTLASNGRAPAQFASEATGGRERMHRVCSRHWSTFQKQRLTALPPGKFRYSWPPVNTIAGRIDRDAFAHGTVQSIRALSEFAILRAKTPGARTGKFAGALANRATK
jgi:hypothetical protein